VKGAAVTSRLLALLAPVCVLMLAAAERITCGAGKFCWRCSV